MGFLMLFCCWLGMAGLIANCLQDRSLRRKIAQWETQAEAKWDLEQIEKWIKFSQNKAINGDQWHPLLRSVMKRNFRLAVNV